MRMEQAKKGPNSLKSCPSCSLAFFCCTEHWTAVEPKHSAMHYDSPDTGPAVPERSQCAINCEIQVDNRFSEIMTGAKIGEFRWGPERMLPQWATLEGKQIGAEFGEVLGKEQGILDSIMVPWMRGASDGLSMPMMILWALEKLNWPDEGWVKKEILTVHVSQLSLCFLEAFLIYFQVLGAWQQEVMKSDVFEEILHRLPEVKKLNVCMYLTIFAFVLIQGEGEARFMWTVVSEYHDGAGGRHQRNRKN